VGADLTAGTALDGSFGAAGRVFRFQAVCERPEPLVLKDVGALPCFLFEVPSRFELDQRRRYFRVRPGGPLTAKVSVLPPEAAADGGEDPLAGPADRSGPPEHALAARVDDLSFSGAGLTIDVDTPGTLVRDSLVHLWIEGDELNRTVSLTGLVRRLQTAPRGRGRVRTSLGVEFVVRGPSDRMGTQALRQYVMSQQRLLLARRSAAADAETDATADAGSEPAPTP
jgi:hypothetical protein